MIKSSSEIDSPIVALDLETRDPLLKVLGPGWAYLRPEEGRGYPVGYAISWRTNGGTGELRREYLPVRHEAGGNMPMDEVRAILQPVLGDPRRTLVGANMTYDYGWTTWDGFDIHAQVDDVQIHAPLLDDNAMSYSLNNLAKRYLGLSKSEDALRTAAREWGLKDPKSDLWKLPADMVREYAEVDAEVTLLLYEHMLPLLEADDLTEVHEVERKLIPCIVDMRRRGVRVDLERADMVHVYLTRKVDAARSALESLTEVPIEPWAASTIIKALEAEGVTEFPVTEKKQDKSVTSEFLQALAASHPDKKAGKIAEQTYLLRKYDKAKSTFIQNMILEHSQAHLDGTHRIHSELKALRGDDGGTVSGRFSSMSPNLQQVPARDPELGPLIRSIFIPFEGNQWASIDYASQEPRLAIHFAELLNCTGAKEFADKWRVDPKMDPYLPTAELCGVTRKDAKTIRLGILYGMGGGKLCDSLGLPTEKGEWRGREVLYAGPEGKELLAKFDANSPMDRELSKLAQDKAKRTGFVRTILKRRSRFPRRDDGQVWFTHKALNRIIQGSAADMTKTAMLRLYESGTTPLLSVHDELCFSTDSRESAVGYSEIMSTAIKLTVPVCCDVEMGKSWGHSMDPDLDAKFEENSK